MTGSIIRQIRTILVALCLGFISAAARAGEHITWLHPEFPPSYIGSGEFARQGYLDLQLTVLQLKMPGFTHSTVAAPLARVWHEMRHADGVCFLGASPTPERLKLGLFSSKGILTPIIQLAMRKEQSDRIRPYLDADGEVDLDKLKSASELTGTYTGTATYGRVIDDFLRSQDHAVTLNKVVEMRHPLTLLEKARTDFIFVWPEQLTYFKRSTHSDFATVSYKVSGTSAAQPYFVACSRGPLGRTAIAQINAILNEPETWHAFVAPLKIWFPPVDYERADRGVE